MNGYDEDNPPVKAYAETAAVFAVLNADHAGARRIIADMTPRERHEYGEQLDQLQAMLTDRLGNDRATAGLG